ncbi:MAG: phosphohistidine phosphatase SixA [Candidatus Micrarchaeota archaeon]
MEVYLVQHGKAKSEEEDPERPLSEVGEADVEKVASKAAALGLRCRVFHSPKLRAKQTADIFASRLKSGAKEVEGLKPMDEPNTALDFIQSQDDSLMLVGHLPHMSKLASLLVAGNENADIVAFRMGAVVCLEKGEKWRIKWILTPELA